MKTRRTLIMLGCVALSAVTAVMLWPESGPQHAPASTHQAAARPRPVEVPMPSPELAATGRPEGGGAGANSVATSDLGAWATEAPPKPDFAKIEAFENWLADWKDASPEERAARAEEGARLASARRPEFKALIMSDPRQALERSVPRVVRQDLPAEIVAALEKPVSATGDLNVYKGRPAPGMPVPAEGLTLRYFEAQGMSYKARVFGELEPMMTKKQIPMRGVAIDREFAVAESPVRQLEVGERIPAGTVVEDTCPVSGKTTDAVATGEPVSADTPTIEVGEQFITVCEPTHVVTLDEQYRIRVQAAGSGGAAFFMDAFPGTSSRAIGNFRCLYIRLAYPEEMTAPNTEDEAAADMRDASRFWMESSYGKMSTTSTITPLIVLPQTKKWYMDKDAEVDGLAVIHNQARVEARKLGYDSNQYDCIIIRVNGGLRGDTSWGGGSSVWLAWGGMDVINHECGHSLGLGHANYWNVFDGVPYGNGENQEYGNGFDVMGGGGGFAAHYHTVAKRNLGWLPSGYVHFPKTNGIYRVHAFDQPQLEEGKRYGLSVAKDANRSYNLEFHANNATLANQALVLYGSHLIDTTPGSSGGKGDGGIQIGRTFSDLEGDMHFTVLSKNNTSPASLDIAYFRGPFPGNVAPAVALAASATTVNVGDTVTFTATATDADGDALAYHWDFDDGTTAANSNVVTKTFTVAAQVTAMVTVSDMKGGTTRRHVVISAGAHGKQMVTGNITLAGQPLANVRVSITNGKYAYTDADGNYALAGVSTGSQTLTATLNGYTFTPSFANPLGVVAGTNTANWTATGATFVTLTKTADATEGGANGSFTLTRTGSTAADLIVRVSPATGTATLTTDYTFTPAYATDGGYRTFTIPAGQASLTISVAAVNDTAQEGPESVSLQVASNGNYLQTTANAAVMTLNDNDTALAQVAVTAPDPYAMEATDAGEFVFSRTGSTAASLNIAVAWTGSATNGGDYTTLPTTVTIPAGQASVSVPVTPVDDALIEVPEDIIATISTNAAYVRNGSATTATITMSDDDTPVVTVSVPDASASEAGPDSGVFLIHRSGSTAAPLKVYYGFSGSAFHGTDYIALSGEVVIPAGATSAPVVIIPYDDDLGEGPETVTLAVTTFNNAYSLGGSFQGSLNLTDNGDLPLITVRAGNIGTEGGSNATVVFRSLGSATGNVTVNYTVSGTATSGTDFTALSGTVTVPASGPSNVSVTIPVTNDALAEPTETVVVKITPSAAYRVYNDGSAEAAIRDNDSGAERVAVSAYHTVPAEGGNTSSFYFTRTGTTGNLTVNYAISGTATNVTDYANLPGTVVIPDGQSGINVAVTPVDDAVAEGTETVTVSVLAAAGYSADRPASATLELTDNDAAAITVGFQTQASTTNEIPGANGQFRDFPVTLSAAAASTVTVQVVAGTGTSASGDDVDWAFVDADNGNAVVPTATLSFAPGVTTRNVRIRVKNDGMVEPGEIVVLELRAPFAASLSSTHATHQLSIFDGTIPTLNNEERWNNTSVYTNQTWSGSSPNYVGYVNGFTPSQNVADNYSRRITGQIVAPTTGTYTFWVASDDSSRLYLSTNSTPANKVQIASVNGWTGYQSWDEISSQKSASISLTAGQSYYMEVQHQEGGGGDHLSVAWEGPGFTRTPIATPIPDEAPRTIRLVTAATNRTEAEGSEPLLMALLDRPAGSTAITVDFSVSGTATAGSDYTLAPGTLTFAPGELVKPLPLAILADAIAETPEAIVVALTNPSGAQLVSPSTHVITVRDSDTPTVDTLFVTANSAMGSGTVLGNVIATPVAGRSISGWTILAGNAGNAFAINAAGQLTLATPAALPNPGGMQLVVRATDNIGACGDGLVNVICNAPANGVVEQRWNGSSGFWSQEWTSTAAYTGTLATFTTGQNVAEDYSRRLTGFLKPAVSGDYTFWIAGDDDCRLFLSSDGSASNKVQIGAVSGWTNYQAWDSQAGQKSAVIPLVAGKVYWMEVHQLEGGGGDHVSVAWQGPGIARQAIPSSVIFPYVTGVSFDNPAVPPTIALTSPVNGEVFDSSENITLEANVAGGSIAVSNVEFYRDSTLIGSDSSAPYSVTWNNVTAGNHVLSAKATYSGGGVTSSGVTVSVQDLDPGSDPDGDGFTTGLELALGTDPNSSASQPSALYANLRAWWKLDESSGTNADDTTGRAQDGTVSGAAWSSGIAGGALSFDGIDDGMLVGASASLIGTTDFSLAAWVKVDPGSPTGTVIQQREPGGSGYLGEYALNVNSNGTVNFFVYGTSVYQFDLTTAAVINDGQWHHLAAVRSGTGGKVYIDGVEAASGSGTIQALQSHALSIGYDHRDNNKRFDGSIDDIRIYERALSVGEIDGLHDALVPNRAPSFTTDPILKAAATEDAAYTGSLAGDASDPDFGDGMIFAKISGPPWLVVAANGALSGTPQNGDVGPNSFSVRVTDPAGLSDDAALSITVNNVNDAPAFTANPINLAGTEDSAMTGSLSATDPDAGDTLTYTKLSGPPWLTVASNGALGGTPLNANVGANNFTVRVTDASGLTNDASLNITVANVNDAPAITANPINLAGTEDSAMTGNLSATDPDAGDTLTYTKLSGPPWLTVATNGALGGTPLNANVGANNFTVRVTDAGGLTNDATLNITVANVNDAPVFTVDPILAANATVGSAYSGQTLAGTATDADAGDGITYSKVSGPAWLSVAGNGALTGTPPSGSGGLNTFVVRATDGPSATDDAELRINVVSLPLPWTNSDIGTGMLAGSTSESSGTFTQAGSGALGGTTDKLQFTCQALTGDGEIIARISSLQNTGTSSRVGVMIRDTLATNSKQIFMGLTSTGNYRWVRRATTGGSASTNNSSTGTVPNTWVRLTRVGNVITAYKSTNGTSWTLVGSTTVTMATNCYIGLAVSSGSNTTLNTSQFSNVSVTP